MRENLIPQSERTKEEQRKIATMGGIASGKARKEKKAMKDTLKTLLSMSLEEQRSTNIEKIKSIAALKGKNITVQEAIMLAQIQKAMKGDTRAAEFIRDSSGNKLKESVEMNASFSNPFEGLTTEQLKKLIGDE